jgi:pimeloyl-ACP methyl ester carboxylesterase
MNWYTHPTVTGGDWVSPSSIMPNHDVTYFARWERNRTTIVLLPGIKGSRLYTGNDFNGYQVWEPSTSGAITGLFEDFLLSDEDGNPIYQNIDFTRRPGDYGATDVYETLYYYLKDNANFPHYYYDVLFFPYDWRLSNEHNAILLEEALYGIENVIFVAHSMGGLVASSYLARSQENRDQVELLITFGTPFIGSTKAIHGFNTGHLLEWLQNLAIGANLKRLAANTVSAFELLPTSRYGSFVTVFNEMGNSQNLSFFESRQFIANHHTWAWRTDGGLKPMFDNSLTFHNSLMFGNTHTANMVNSYYIVGTGQQTRDIAVYITFDNMHESLTMFSHFTMTDGDETVTTRSASNGRTSNIFTVNDTHTGIVSNPFALDAMRSAIITRNNEVSTGLQEITSFLEMESTGSARDISNYISVVIQGAENLDIYDSHGNRLLQEGQTMYRQTRRGVLERVGKVFPINEEMLRFQYVLDPDEYVFTNISFTDGIPVDILTMNFENWTQTSMVRYTNFQSSSHMEIHVSSNTSQLSDVTQRNIIEPTMVSTQYALRSINESITQHQTE